MPKEIGEIVWVDLTIPNAEEVRQFYNSVIGWEADEYKMADYSDYVIKSPKSKQSVAGICHAKGDNASLPPQWLIYIKVENLEKSITAAELGGGEILDGPKQAGTSRMCVLKDPAGAVLALIEEEAEDEDAN